MFWYLSKSKELKVLGKVFLGEEILLRKNFDILEEKNKNLGYWSIVVEK